MVDTSVDQHALLEAAGDASDGRAFQAAWQQCAEAPAEETQQEAPAADQGDDAQTPEDDLADEAEGEVEEEVEYVSSSSARS